VFFDVLFNKNKVKQDRDQKTKNDFFLCRKIAAERIWVKEHRLLAPSEAF
jgi:hypothetical protein